jgi:LmbE family N-acetylglucosaminyl deacetylase
MTGSRSMRRLLGHPARSALGAWWSVVFSVAGHVLRPAARELAFTAGERVLALAAHPDDETIGCGGTLARHAAARDEVLVVCVTDGRRSRALDLDERWMAATRAAEFAAAMAELGVEGRLLGVPESLELDEDALTAELARLLDEWQPSLVYSPSRVDEHPNHITVARALARALRRVAGGPDIRCYQGAVPLTPILVNSFARTDPVADELERAGRCYASQYPNIVRGRRLAAQCARLYRLAGRSEFFWSMTADQFSAVTLRAAAAPAAPPFRGLRALPLTDGLAWLAGLRSRRRHAQRGATSTIS